MKQRDPSTLPLHIPIAPAGLEICPDAAIVMRISSYGIDHIANGILPLSDAVPYSSPDPTFLHIFSSPFE